MAQPLPDARASAVRRPTLAHALCVTRRAEFLLHCLHVCTPQFCHILRMYNRGLARQRRQVRTADGARQDFVEVVEADALFVSAQVQAAQNLERAVGAALHVTETMMTHLPLNEGDATRVPLALKCLQELLVQQRSGGT